jgi:lysophospholipase L1-like esterase
MPPVPDNSIIFIGNSIVEFFPLNELIPGKNLINRGISGDYTSGVLQRIHALSSSKPRCIFLEIGINDVLRGVSDDSIAKNLNRIIDISRPSKLLVISILPTNFEAGLHNEKIDRINKNLILLCAKNRNVEYVDINSAMKLDGKMDPSLTYDGIHLNSKGYWLFAEKLTPFINEALATSR